MLRVTCHMSLTPTATATDPPPSPDPGFFFVIAYLDLVPLLVGVIRRERKKKEKNICWSSRTILLCIVGELAGGGTMAVAVGVSDM